MKLSDLTAIHTARGPLLRIMSNGREIWAPGGDPEPPAGLVWAGGFRMVLSGAVATHTGVSDRMAHAYSDPLTAGNTYFEIESSMFLPDNRGGIWVSDAPFDLGFSLPLGQFTMPGTPSLGGAGDGEWWWSYYANDVPRGGQEPDHTIEPRIRWGIAHAGSARMAWIRQVWPGGASSWDGDPTAGTSPSVTFPGTAAARIGATATDGNSITIIAPADHYGAAPAGFTPV